jgi:hypothetical protein
MYHSQFLYLSFFEDFQTSINFVSLNDLSSLRAFLMSGRGLAISDLLMAINFLSSSAKNLAGPHIGILLEKTFCSFNGFMIQVFVVQSMPLI